MAVSAIFLVLIFLLVNPAELVGALKTVRYDYLALSAAGVALFLLLRALRWRFLLDNDIGFMQVFHIQNVGYMVSNLFPFRIGDVVRAVLVGKLPPVNCWGEQPCRTRMGGG